MPTNSKRLCSKCHRGLTDGVECTVCGKVKRTWASDKQRGTRTQRGYDNAWLRLRDAYKRRHPLCEVCEKMGRVTPTEQVDHIEPFDGINDPKRLQWSNLQSLCREHHTEKHGRAT